MHIRLGRLATALELFQSALRASVEGLVPYVAGRQAANHTIKLPGLED